MAPRNLIPLALLALLLASSPAGALAVASSGKPLHVRDPTLLCVDDSGDPPPTVRVLAQCGGARIAVNVTSGYVEVTVTLDCGHYLPPVVRCHSRVLRPSPVYLP